MAMWRSWLRCQSSHFEFVCSSPAGCEKLTVAQTFSRHSYKRCVLLVMHVLDDSTLSAYNPQLLRLYTPEWRLRKSI